MHEEDAPIHGSGALVHDEDALFLVSGGVMRDHDAYIPREGWAVALRPPTLPAFL
jgi:hypothetical protein